MREHGDEIPELEGRARESVKKQDHRGLLIPRLPVEKIYAIDSDSFYSSNWCGGHFVFVVDECDGVQEFTSPSYMYADTR